MHMFKEKYKQIKNIGLQYYTQIFVVLFIV